MDQNTAPVPKTGGRRARVLVIGGDSRALGCLPTIDLARPWWMETDDLLAALRERYGLDAVVLRLLSASSPRLEPGAEVTYAVEALGALPQGLPLDACPEVPLGDDADPLRMTWARPGGVVADIAWADAALAALGRRRIGPAAQMRSWNLSLLIRLTTDEGVVWLKHVPPFLRHEGAVMALVREEGGAVPTVLDAAPADGRLLLEDVSGEDSYAATAELAVRMVESLVALQLRMTKRRTSITAAGGLDWSSATFLQEMPRLAARGDVRAVLGSTEQVALDELVKKLPAMLDALCACGLEDTLVHGDFHPGNHRFNGEKLVLLDWGDSGIGHPLLDMASFLDRIPIEQLDTVRHMWDTAWKDAYPNANVSLAAELIRPLAALRAALIYRRFLDGIEASERVYHNLDVSEWLRRAISVAPL